MSLAGPHQGKPLLRAGAPLDGARAAMVLVHGRGATAQSILEIAAVVNTPGVAYLAPQAAANEWYPYRFMEPIADNEPGISSGMTAIADAIGVATDAGIAPDRVGLLGFSQGACLALEYSARHARRYGAVAGLSGGLIGPDGTPRDYQGSLDGAPVLLGCSDVDPHIPLARVHETASVLQRLGGLVDLRIYPGMGHVVNEDEIQAVRDLLMALTLGVRG